MLFTSSLATALFVASAVALPPRGPHAVRSSPTGQGLIEALQARGRCFIGTAITLRNDTAEAALRENKADFNSMTPENALKWQLTQPGRDNFTFDQGDAHMQYAEDKQLQTHCHTLVWHNQLPEWVSGGGFDNATLIQIMKDHITAVAGRYKGRCTRWDVVNEALNADGTYRESVFYKTIGEAFIPIAFQHASEVDPDAQLFYNDYDLEYATEKALGAQRIVKLIQSYGAKINGVGFQCHLASEITPSANLTAPDQATLNKALGLMTSLDVDVAYTEIDVRMNTPSTPEKLATQSDVYERIAMSCLEEERCIGMTLWGVSDKYSWIQYRFPGEGAALPWNETFAKKPAYDGFLKGIQGGGQPAPPSLPRTF